MSPGNKIKTGTPDFLDIVFENKNKAYGAYVLSRAYNKHVSVALIIATTLVFLGFAIPKLLQKPAKETTGTIKVKYTKTIEYSELSAPPPIESVLPATPVKSASISKPKTTVKYLPPVAKPDEEVEEEEIIPTQEELRHKAPDTKSVEGDGDVFYEGGDEVELEILVPEEDEEIVAEEIVEPKEEKREVYLLVEHMPEFPGGEQALLEYISRMIKYPKMALENNIEGIVVVEFVIDINGSVTDIKVLRGIGGMCNEEAVRVVASMPGWKPGRQGDIIVPVRYVLPIKFELKEAE